MSSPSSSYYYNPIKKLNTPTEFPFPFEPYEIQKNFMRQLYGVLEYGRIGIFESPTGTGKSLSLMCGTLKWLSDHDQLIDKEINEQINEIKEVIRVKETIAGAGGDWLTSQSETIKLKEQAIELTKILNLLNKRTLEIKELKKKTKQKNAISKRWRSTQPPSSSSSSSSQSRPDFLNDNKVILESVNEQNKEDDDDHFLIEDIDGNDDDDDDDNTIQDEYIEKFEPVQIFFCSRTHSQLSQVVNELKSTEYGNQFEIVSLASRQNYCINPEVKKSSNHSNVLINERCLELQKGASHSKCNSKITAIDSNTKTIKKKQKIMETKTTKCPFNSNQIINNLKDSILTDILDIEDLIKVSKTEKACPYYATRLAAQTARIIMLPYQMLLHQRTRQQTGLKLKNNIVIIDEGHNLIDTISNIYSAELTLEQLQRSHQQLLSYKLKYFSKFSTKNLLLLNQFIFVCNRLIKLLDIKVVAAGDRGGGMQSRIILAHEVMVEGEFFNIKLNEILDFCDRTRLVQKVHGFSLKYGNVVVQNSKYESVPKKINYLKELSEKVSKQKQNDGNSTEQLLVEKSIEPIENSDNLLNQTSALRPLIGFLNCLMEKSHDGRVLFNYAGDMNGPRGELKSKASMKFVLLNPSDHFSEILKECRSVIIAGGTMQPTTDFKNQLLSSQPSDRINEYFFGHVIPKESILPLTISKGPTNQPFLFNFMNRSNKDLLTELSRTLQNVCNVVPAGIVCFFCSYDFMDQFYKFLNDTGALDIIKKRKIIFREPRSANQTEKMLLEYNKAVKTTVNNCKNGIQNGQTGAFLLSVIGGKLSEGLNFSDDLGRCVCVVGLPFPNKHQPELAEKIRYLEKLYGSTAGNEYYENICMKAVNQSIGRAVRHINDYATVLLIDERYGQEKIIKKLPEWISRSLLITTGYNTVPSNLAKFFRNKKSLIKVNQ